MSRSKVKAGEGYVEIGIRNRIAAGAKGVQSDLKKLASKAGKTGKLLAGIGLSVAGPMVAATLSFAKAGDELDKMSKRTGLSVESLSSLSFAAEQSGSNLAAVEKGVKGMQRSLYDAEQGSTAIVDALGALGVSAEELGGMLPEDQFTILADKIGSVGDPSKRAALAMKIFGKSGADLLPMFGENAKGIAELRREAEELGRVMSAEDAAAAAELTDSMNRVMSVVRGVVLQVGGALAPALTKASEFIVQLSSGAADFISENRQIIQVVGAGALAIVGLGASLVGLGGFIAVASMAVGGITAAIAFIASPIGIAIAAVGALGYAAVKYTSIAGDSVDWLKERFGPLVASVTDSVAAITEALAAGDMEKAWELTTSMIEMVWLDLTGEMQDLWADATGFILDAGTSTAEAIGKVFQVLVGTLGTMLDAYKSTYDAIYNYTSDTLNGFSGVETIGGPAEAGSAFERDFGSVEDSLRAAIDGVDRFGESMGESARAQQEDRREARDAARAERIARLESLRGTAAVEAEAAEKSGKVRKEKEARDKEMADRLAALNKGAAEIGTVEAVEAKAKGPTATFSAAAAMIIGSGPVNPNQKLEALTERVAKATEAGWRELAKNFGEPANLEVAAKAVIDEQPQGIDIGSLFETLKSAAMPALGGAGDAGAKDGGDVIHQGQTPMSKIAEGVMKTAENTGVLSDIAAYTKRSSNMGYGQ